MPRTSTSERAMKFLAILLPLICLIVAIESQVPGGWSAIIESPDDTVRQRFDAIRPDLSSQMNDCLPETRFEVLKYRSQVVNGVNYIALVKVITHNKRSYIGVKMYYGPAGQNTTTLSAWKYVQSSWNLDPW